jgi:hypothetical protein
MLGHLQRYAETGEPCPAFTDFLFGDGHLTGAGRPRLRPVMQEALGSVWMRTFDQEMDYDRSNRFVDTALQE